MHANFYYLIKCMIYQAIPRTEGFEDAFQGSSAYICILTFCYTIGRLLL